MPGHNMPPKRNYLSKFARSQRQRLAREKKLHDANPDRATNDIKKEVVRKLCTNSSFFSITKIKNQHNGSVEVRYDEAPYIRLLHQSGLNYVDIEKILKEEGRYVSRQTISLVARNLKKTLFRVLHIPKPVDITDDARQWIEKCFAENASVGYVREKLEELFGISASLYQLISIKKELQNTTAALTPDAYCFGKMFSKELSLLNLPRDIKTDTPCVENPMPELRAVVRYNSSEKIAAPESETCSYGALVTSAESETDGQQKIENGTNPGPSDSGSQEEEPLSIICCPDVLPYTSNVSPFPLDTNNEEINSDDDGAGLNGQPLSIVCCPDLPTESLVEIAPNHSEPTFLPIRKGRKAPPDHISVLSPAGNFTSEFLRWAKRHSTWEGNFASTLAQNIFTDKERLESNCMGVRKKALDPNKLYQIRQAVFEMYDVTNENKGKTWNNCIKAIDSASRTFRCKNKGHYAGSVLV